MENIQSSRFVKHVFEGIRDDMFDKLNSISKEKLWEYIKNSWMDAGYLEPPYIIVTGRGTNENYTAEINDRNELDGEDLTLEKVEWDKIRIY